MEQAVMLSLSKHLSLCLGVYEFRSLEWFHSALKQRTEQTYRLPEELLQRHFSTKDNVLRSTVCGSGVQAVSIIPGTPACPL
jgi:hypothetical protein